MMFTSGYIISVLICLEVEIQLETKYRVFDTKERLQNAE